MASVAALSLVICLLGQQCLARSNAPCQHSSWENGFKTFVERHIYPGALNNTNEDWMEYIKNHKGCDRPTQSFIPIDELEEVKAVCTSQGGKIYKGNLCISKQSFNFTTVRIHNGTCAIKNVTEESKYLILACDNQNNQCLPVHFEGNPHNIKPEMNATGCQDPNDKATHLNMSGLWLLSVLLLVVFWH